MHQRRKAADKIHTNLFARFIQRDGKRCVIYCARRLTDDGNRRNRDAFIDDGNAKFRLDLLARFDEVFRLAQNFFLDFANGSAHILAHAIFERNAHGDRPNIQALMPDHLDGAQNISGIDHCLPPRCGAWNRKSLPAGGAAPCPGSQQPLPGLPSGQRRNPPHQLR